MQILLTGATGYIGKRLLPDLLNQGHQVYCMVRDKNRFAPGIHTENIFVVEADLLKPETLANIPDSIEVAFYLVHSMSGTPNYQQLELQSAQNFVKRLNHTQAQQVIYLSGMANATKLSTHLQSRLKVEQALQQGNFALTALRAGIIIGSGSASFEIIRDLVEKLPVMVAPKWLNTRCQPIGIADVITCLSGAIGCKQAYNHNFDIGGPDVLTYKQMLLGFARIRKLKRYIFTVPVMTPRLSSYWLFFITATSYKLAVALVDSMKIEVVCRNHDFMKIIGLQPMPYTHALRRTFDVISQAGIVSSWKDAMIGGRMPNENLSDYINVPTYGCFIDKRQMAFANRQQTLDRIWKIGGQTGWYYGTWLWKIRGYLDKIVGGVGLRRGRTNPNTISTGDAIDFWRVLYANPNTGRLLLYAEMKLPGEAWLEFNLKENQLVQTATFRPWGLWGRAYWYAVLPFHGFIFKGMLKKITK